ncbi:MAG: hypothetical protein HW389_772 [Bacteroidetes bacterium]|nr:hypothetical protein [Bacteroidota bacterium]
MKSPANSIVEPSPNRTQPHGRNPAQGGEGGGPRIGIRVASGDVETCPVCRGQLVKARACVFCPNCGFRECSG